MCFSEWEADEKRQKQQKPNWLHFTAGWSGTYYSSPLTRTFSSSTTATASAGGIGPALIGLHQCRAGGLVALLAHYPCIVYLGFSLWQKLLFVQTSQDPRECYKGGRPSLMWEEKGEKGEGASKKRRDGGGVRKVNASPAHLGMIGDLAAGVRATLQPVFMKRRVAIRTDTISKSSPFHFGYFLTWLVMNNQLDCVSLLASTWEVDLGDGWGFAGMTPVHAAASGGSPQMLRLLASRGADLYHQQAGRGAPSRGGQGGPCRV
jgi:hypothetical protein